MVSSTASTFITSRDMYMWAYAYAHGIANLYTAASKHDEEYPLFPTKTKLVMIKFCYVMQRFTLHGNGITIFATLHPPIRNLVDVDAHSTGTNMSGKSAKCFVIHFSTTIIIMVLLSIHHLLLLAPCLMHTPPRIT